VGLVVMFAGFLRASRPATAKVPAT
jgi:hypothetical protein